MKTPTLWGYDPKARYEYTPFICRNLPEEEQVVFTLRAPNQRVFEEVTRSEADLAREARKRAPEAYATFRRLSHKKLEELSEEESADMVAAREQMDTAFADAADEFSAVPVMAKVLAFCVVGWKNFKDANGAELALPEDRRDIVDMLPHHVAKELFDQCKLGASISQEEKTSLR